MKIGNYLCCCYIIISLEILDESHYETPLSICPFKKLFKVKVGFANFTDVCIKYGGPNSTNSCSQLFFNQLEKRLSIVLIFIIINIILAFVLWSEIRFQLINKNQKLKRKTNKRKEKLNNETNDVDVELQKIKDELEMKEKIISENKAHIDMINNHAENLTDEIRNLNDQLKKSLNDLKFKDSEIDKFRDDIESKIIEIKKLEQKNEAFNKHLKDIEENSLSHSESDSLTCEEHHKSKKLFLNEINKRTGNEFNSLHSCIALINKLSNNAVKKEENYIQKENFQRSTDVNKEYQLEIEIEELNDQIYILESKCKTVEKRYKNQLKSKDEEIEELQEELEIAELKKHQDNKSKIQIKALEERIEELSGDIESRIEKIKLKNEKLKEIVYKCNNFETRFQEIEIEIDRLKKDKIELTQIINNKNKGIDEIVQIKNEEVKEKQNDLEEMKKEMEKEKIERDKLKMINEQHTVKINKCISDLAAEKENYGKLISISNDQQKKIKTYETKIKALEDEIHHTKISKFKNPDNFIENEDESDNLIEKVNNKWYPIWWDKHIVCDRNNHQNENEQPDQISVDVSKILLSCPNCYTMYSPTEIEHHVHECLENDN